MLLAKPETARPKLSLRLFLLLVGFFYLVFRRDILSVSVDGFAQHFKASVGIVVLGHGETT